MPAVITNRSKVDISQVTRLFGHSEAIRRWQIRHRQADKGFSYPHIGTGKTFNSLCTKMLSATSHVCPARQYVTAETLTRQEPMSGREYLPFVRAKARFAGLGRV